MELSQQKQYILLGIIISVLMHTSILLFFTVKKQYEQAIPVPMADAAKPQNQTFFMPPPQQKKKANLEVGHKLMPKSNALPVMQKAPDNSVDNITPPAKPAPQTPQKQQPQQPKKAEKKQAQPPEKPKSKPTLKKEKIKQAEKKEVEKKADKAIELSGQKSKIQNKNVEKKHLTQPKPTKEIPVKKEQKVEKHEPIIEKKVVKAQAEQIKPPPAPPKQTAPPAPPADKKEAAFSLKDLQKGFTKFLRHGNNDVMSRKGDKSIDATPEDLKLMSYYRQVMNTIESAISYVGRLDTSHFDHDKNVHYSLLINRDGTISNISFIQKSKHEHLNNHAAKVLENMGSLPPLPHYIEAPHIFRSGFAYFQNQIRYY
jgi:outer membrane biosynthesis protein TonB